MTGSIRVVILTVSDRSYRGERPDGSGPALVHYVQELGWNPVETHILPDEADRIEVYLREQCARGDIDLLLTAGGTGFAPRDVTPEATRAVIQREAPGLMEAIRVESLKITPHGMLSRGVSGIRARTLIVNLSGSPKAAVEQLAVIATVLPHALSLLREEDGEDHQAHPAG
jgi:molybdenum cofactor synthesis domain-containing protein